MPDTSPHLNWWGKTRRNGDTGDWHPAAYHMLDVAAVSHHLAQLPELNAALGPVAPWAPFLVALHDVGKFSDVFQRLSPAHYDSLHPDAVGAPPLHVRHRHTETGYALLCELSKPGLPLHRLGIDASPGWRRVLCAIAGHHGKPTRDVTEPGYGYKLGDAYRRDGLTAALGFLSDVQSLLAPGPSLPALPQNQLRRLSWHMSGLTVMADWLGSSATFRFERPVRSVAEYWRDCALPRAERAVKQAGLGLGVPAAKRPFAELFPHLSHVTPSPLQRAAAELVLPAEPSIVVLEDIPGSGKTEAAISIINERMAAGAAGAFIALPTTATANGLYDRVNEGYRRLFTAESQPSLVLAHGRSRYAALFRDTVLQNMAGTASPDTALCSAWLADNRRLALLADFGVGTIDQALLAAMPAKFNTLRLLGLAGKVLCVDEVHACDAYMHGLLRVLVRFQALLGGSVVLLSATMTLRQRGQLIADFARGCGQTVNQTDLDDPSYPAMTSWSAGASIRNVAVAPASERTIEVARLGSVEEAVEMLVGASRNGLCGAWVRNTVRDANAAYDLLVRELGPDRVVLFHARFAAGDREMLEADLLDVFGHPRRATKMALRPGRIVVATQVIEQSLDVDFDVMVSDLAPVDLLIQRSGRLQRHDRGKRLPPVLHILSPPPNDDVDEEWFARMFPGGAWVYPHHGRLWTTMRLLTDTPTIRLPRDVRGLVEAVYDDGANVPEGLVKRSIEARATELAHAAQGRRSVLTPEDGYFWDTGWDDDEFARTRLGDNSVEVRLFRDMGGNFAPWGNGDGIKPFADGDVRLRASDVDDEDDSQKAFQDYLRDVDFGDRHFIAVAMSLRNGIWSGSARRQGSTVVVTASPLRGIEVRRSR